MSQRTVTLRGVASLRRVLRQAPDDMKSGLQQSVSDSLEEVEAEMLANVPRDTGELASVIAIKKSRDGLSGRVGPGVRGKRDQRKIGGKPKFVEFGTQHMAAQPFVFPALRAKKDGIRARLAAGVANVLLMLGRRG